MRMVPLYSPPHGQDTRKHCEAHYGRVAHYAETREIKSDWKAAAKRPCPQAMTPTTRWRRSTNSQRATESAALETTLIRFETREVLSESAIEFGVEAHRRFLSSAAYSWVRSQW